MYCLHCFFCGSPDLEFQHENRQIWRRLLVFFKNGYAPRVNFGASIGDFWNASQTFGCARCNLRDWELLKYSYLLWVLRGMLTFRNRLLWPLCGGRNTFRIILSVTYRNLCLHRENPKPCPQVISPSECECHMTSDDYYVRRLGFAATSLTPLSGEKSTRHCTGWIERRKLEN